MGDRWVIDQLSLSPTHQTNHLNTSPTLSLTLPPVPAPPPLTPLCFSSVFFFFCFTPAALAAFCSHLFFFFFGHTWLVTWFHFLTSNQRMINVFLSNQHTRTNHTQFFFLLFQPRLSSWQNLVACMRDWNRNYVHDVHLCLISLPTPPLPARCLHLSPRLPVFVRGQNRWPMKPAYFFAACCKETREKETRGGIVQSRCHHQCLQNVSSALKYGGFSEGGGLHSFTGTSCVTRSVDDRLQWWMLPMCHSRNTENDSI